MKIVVGDKPSNKLTVQEIMGIVDGSQAPVSIVSRIDTETKVPI